MPFPIPEEWNRDTADIRRNEKKRTASPTSFFFAQGRMLVLAADYFHDDRLISSARGGVAIKHRHRMHLSLFGQLMASFEFMLKDFVSQVIDAVGTFDEKVQKCKWLQVDTERVLSFRVAPMSPGAMLVHSSLGWHSPETVNERYSTLFEQCPIENSEIPNLEKLWIIRHSVAHNAGFIIAHDAVRIGAAHLADKVAAINGNYLKDAFDFLRPIAKRTAEGVGDRVLMKWLSGLKDSGEDFTRDRTTYIRLKSLATYIESRARALPEFTNENYTADFQRIP